MNEYLPIIESAPMFQSIEPGEIEAMLNCLGARESGYDKGAFILREGQSVADMGLLLSGAALIVQEDFWGNRNLLARISPGQLFAEAFACAGETDLTVSIIAEAACRVLWLNVRRLLATCPTACQHHSRMIRNLLADLADKNLRFNEKLIHISQRSTREKLLSYLSAEARRQGAAEFDIPFNRQQLADYLSVERSAMSAELGRLRDEGALTFKKDHFHLLINN